MEASFSGKDMRQLYWELMEREEKTGKGGLVGWSGRKVKGKAVLQLAKSSRNWVLTCC